MNIIYASACVCACFLIAVMIKRYRRRKVIREELSQQIQQTQDLIQRIDSDEYKSWLLSQKNEIIRDLDEKGMSIGEKAIEGVENEIDGGLYLDLIKSIIPSDEETDGVSEKINRAYEIARYREQLSDLGNEAYTRLIQNASEGLITDQSNIERAKLEEMKSSIDLQSTNSIALREAQSNLLDIPTLLGGSLILAGNAIASNSPEIASALMKSDLVKSLIIDNRGAILEIGLDQNNLLAKGFTGVVDALPDLFVEVAYDTAILFGGELVKDEIEEYLVFVVKALSGVGKVILAYKLGKLAWDLVIEQKPIKIMKENIRSKLEVKNKEIVGLLANQLNKASDQITSILRSDLNNRLLKLNEDLARA